MSSFDETICVILAGGAGSRLYPLTVDRAKPAVPFGGKYRIIDFTLSNCLHSAVRRVLVLTQYKSHSLQKHLRDGWSIYNPDVGEYITPVPPQMRTGESWYSGTAGAIYQNLYLIERSGAQQVLILSGDHIYRMDYAAMLTFHKDVGATLTVACMDVEIAEAESFGVMSIDESRRIRDFEEKPSRPQSLPGDPQRALVSMGIYIFDRHMLCRETTADHSDSASAHDFGRDLLPRLINSEQVFAYRFGGPRGRVTQDRYWRDVGTIDAYFQANMDLLDPIQKLDLYQTDWPVRTYSGQNPPARMIPAKSGRPGELDNSILSSGSVICGGSVRRSILSPRVYVADGATVESSLLLDRVRVGAGARLRNCIIDKNVEIPAEEQIGFDSSFDAQRFTVSDNGIVVIPKGYCFSSAGN